MLMVSHHILFRIYRCGFPDVPRRGCVSRVQAKNVRIWQLNERTRTLSITLLVEFDLQAIVTARDSSCDSCRTYIDRPVE